MRKGLLSFVVLILTFSLSEAQDSIAFKSGEKDAVNITTVTKKKINFILDDTDYSVGQERINYIKYKNTRYTFEQLSAKFDSTNRVANAELDKHDTTDYRPIYFNFGVGVSSIETEVTNNDGLVIGDLGPYLISQSPVYNFTVEYRFIRGLSIGVGATYQSLTDNPSEEPTNYSVNPAETEKITKYNYSGKVAYHILKHTLIDVYAGVRVGESMWNEQITSNSQASNAVIYKTPVPASAVLSYQAFVGCVWPIYDFVGIHAEVGAGTPYFVEGGITLLIKTRKK